MCDHWLQILVASCKHCGISLYMLEYNKRQANEKRKKITKNNAENPWSPQANDWTILISVDILFMLCRTNLRFFQINTWAGRIFVSCSFFGIFFPAHFLRSIRLEWKTHICRLYKKCALARTMFIAKSPIGVFACLSPPVMKIVHSSYRMHYRIHHSHRCVLFCLRLCFACLAIC